MTPQVSGLNIAQRIRANKARRTTGNLAKSLLPFRRNASASLEQPRASSASASSETQSRRTSRRVSAMQQPQRRLSNQPSFRRRSSDSEIGKRDMTRLTLQALSKRKTFHEGDKKASIRDVVRDIRNNPDDVVLLIRKCNALRDFGSEQMGSADCIIEVMRHLPKENALQTACIGALWSVCADGRTEVKDTGGAKMIIEAMWRFRNDSELLSQGLGALSCLGKGAGGRACLLDELIITTVENILKKFYKAREGKEVLYWALVCLNTLVSDYGATIFLDKSAASRRLSMQSLQESFHERDDGWECKDCSMLNTNHLAAICEVCGNDRKDDDTHSEQKTSIPHTKQVSNNFVDYDAEEEFNTSERSRNSIRKSQISSLVLKAVHHVSMDGNTLELALKFLCHFDLDRHINEDRALLIEACNQAIQQPHGAFQELHNLACAILCVTMRMNETDNEDKIMSRNFVEAALDFFIDCDTQRHSSGSEFFPSIPDGATISTGSTLTTETTLTTSSSAPNGTPSHVSYEAKVQDVMLSLLSNLICFGNTKLDSEDSEDLLDFCCAALGDGSGVFPSCWIIWSILNYSPSDIQKTSLALEAAQAVQHIIPKIEHIPTLLTLAFASISVVIQHSNFDDTDPPLIDTMTKLLSKYSNVEMLSVEACQLLFYLCQTKDDAVSIINADIFDAVTKPIGGDSTKQCQMAAYLMIKLAALAGDDALSLEDLEAVVNASVALKDDSLLAAKSWLSFLTESISPDKDDVTSQALSMAVSSITSMMESFPRELGLLKLACMALRNTAVSMQQAKLSLDVDISTSISLVLNAQKEHGVQIHEECCNALWALMGVECELEPEILREVIYFAIEVTEIHVVSPEYAFSDAVVIAGIAIMAETLTNPNLLGEMLVDTMVDVLNKCFYLYLDREEDKPKVFEHGFCALQRLCENDTCRDIVVNHGGIVAVVDGMVAHLDNASIQEDGCHILWRLAWNDEDLETKLNIVEADGVDVILNVIITHGDNGGVLAEAFQALSCLSVDKSSRNFIGSQGGIMLIANSMSTLAENDRVQEMGLVALSNIVSDVNESLIQGSNIIAVIHESLNLHAKKQLLMQKGLTLLNNLSVREGIRERLISSGCMKNATEALKLHPSCPSVISSALGFLLNFSDTEEFNKVLRDKKVMKSIVQAMLQNVEDNNVSIAGCNILHLAACDNEISNMGIGGFEAVVYVMTIHHSSEYIQDTCCRILAQLSSQSFMSFMWSGTSFDVDLFDLTCALVDVLLSAMSGFHRSFQLQEQGVIALRNISKYENNTVVLFTEQARIEDVFAEIRERFPELQDQCSEVLKVLLS